TQPTDFCRNIAERGAISESAGLCSSSTLSLRQVSAVPLRGHSVSRERPPNGDMDCTRCPAHESVYERFEGAARCFHVDKSGGGVSFLKRLIASRPQYGVQRGGERVRCARARN